MPFTYLKDAGVSLGICNDAEHVYIMFMFRDPKLLLSASGKGFTAWFDKSGAKKKDFGVRYICNPTVNFDPAKGERPGFGDPSRQRMPMPGAQKPVIEQLLVLFGPEEQGINLKLDGSLGPAASLGNLNGVFTYELAIPLDQADKGLYAIGAEAGTDISIGFEIGGMGGGPPGGGKGGGPPGGGKGSGPPGGMGGGPPGGGRGGGPPGGGMGGGSQDKDIWINYTLAKPSIPENKSE